MDDQRVGRALRLLRQRRGLTQAEVAAAAGVSQSLMSLLERGHLDTVSLRSVRAVFGVLDARTQLLVSWRGGAIDRLLDEAHARIVACHAPTLAELGWSVAIEATYSVYGERGSIDVLGAQPAARVALVEEVKSELTSLEGLGRKTDEKVRLVKARLCRERFGFDPVAVGRLVVLPDTATARRHVARLGPVLDVMFPARNRAVRAWLRRPIGDIAGILFVADRSRGGRIADQRGRTRVRRPRSAGLRA
jgi:transcriptional regulator with XRE-family HTH domain